jgi:hypothetical protein
MHARVLRRLHIGYASILDQAHRLPRKLPSLHDPPSAPSKHLTGCLRNRVQAYGSIERISGETQARIKNDDLMALYSLKCKRAQRMF